MRYRDKNLRWSDWSDTLQFAVTPVGLAENDLTNSLEVYPNPNTGNFTLSLPQNTTHVAIYNATGQLVEKMEGNIQSLMNVALYENGIYFVIVNTDNTTYKRKVIVCE